MTEKASASLRVILPEGIGRLGLLILSIFTSQKSFRAFPAEMIRKAAIATIKTLAINWDFNPSDNEPDANSAPRKTEMKAINPFIGLESSIKYKILRIKVS
jgi:hypothetical protein